MATLIQALQYLAVEENCDGGMVHGHMRAILENSEVDEQEQERADEVAAEVYEEWIRDGSMDVDEVHAEFYDADLDDAVGREW